MQAEIYRRGNELNIPLRTISLASMPDQAAGKLPSSQTFLRPDHPNIMVESVKKAEDGDDIVVRLYETSGTHVSTTLHCGFGATEAWTTDLMENILTAPLGEASNQIAPSLRHLKS